VKPDVAEPFHSAVTSQPNIRFDPVPCRDDFAPLAERLFKKTGVAVEVGVFTGDFSAKNLEKWKGQYYMVDAWAFRPNDPKDKNMNDRAWNDANKEAATNITSFASDRRHIVQALSQEGAKAFSDASIDWLYLDALHTHDALLKDLAAWYPKVRPGGLLTGDDYGDVADTEMLQAYRWLNKFGNVAKDNDWGVISALSKFFKDKAVALHVTWMTDCYPYPAWYAVKPEN